MPLSKTPIGCAAGASGSIGGRLIGGINKRWRCRNRLSGRGIALIAHPNPVQGGTRDNKVDLLAHVLAGLSTREAAQAMGIALSTALTYRYRAFHRLGIRNQRELLGLRGVGVKIPLQKQ